MSEYDARQYDARQTPGGGWVPVPDPTKLTDEAISRATTQYRRELGQLRELLETRLNGMDLATVEARDVAARIRLEIEEKITHLSEMNKVADVAMRQLIADQTAASAAETRRVFDVMQEKFLAVDGRFSESKVAVDAAFAAAKEAVAEQNKGNDRAITKSEGAVKEQLSALGTVTQAGLAGLQDKIEDARTRLTALESRTAGITQATGTARDDRTEGREVAGLARSQTMAVLVGLALLVSVVSVIVTFVVHS